MYIIKRENVMNEITHLSIARYKKHWVWYSLLGILLVILGTIGASYSVAITAVAMLWVGVIVIIAAIIEFIYAFSARGWSGLVLQLLLSLITLLIGIFIIAYPLKASVVFTLFIAIYLIVAGILRIIFAFNIREFNIWWIILIGGLISLILGILILVHWPVSGLWVFGLFVCVEIVVTGISMIFMSLLARAEG